METHKLLDEESRKRFTEPDNDLFVLVFGNPESPQEVYNRNHKNEYRFISSYSLRDYEF